MAKYRVETDKGSYIVETEDSVPGMEKLGGSAPGPVPPRLPHALQPPDPEWNQNTVMGTAGHLLASPVTGLLSVPGQIKDWAMRGGHNAAPSGGFLSDEPVTQAIGDAAMAVGPEGAKNGAVAGRGFVRGAAKAIKEAPPSPVGKTIGRVAGATAGAAAGKHLGGWEGAAIGGYAGGELGSTLGKIPDAVRSGVKQAGLDVRQYNAPPRSPAWQSFQPPAPVAEPAPLFGPGPGLPSGRIPGNIQPPVTAAPPMVLRPLPPWMTQGAAPPATELPPVQGPLPGLPSGRVPGNLRAPLPKSMTPPPPSLPEPPVLPTPPAEEAAPAKIPLAPEHQAVVDKVILENAQKAAEARDKILVQPNDAMPQRYKDSIPGHGTLYAEAAWNKDLAIAQRLKDQGVSPEEWLKMDLPTQNGHVTALGYKSLGKGGSRGRPVVDAVNHIHQTLTELYGSTPQQNQ